jgi:hypothetical protein
MLLHRRKSFWSFLCTFFSPIQLIFRKLTSEKSPSTQDSHAVHLFKLPLELRTRIYTYVLGGNAIHCDRVGRCGGSGCRRPRYAFARCAFFEEAEQYTVQEHNHNEPRDSMTGRPRDGHEECRTSVRPNLLEDGPVDEDLLQEESRSVELDLLGVCRQIYSEARLLPFQENVFVIDVRENDCDLALVRELSPPQAMSIGGLSFRCFNSFPRLSVPDVAKLGRFRRLKFLEVSIDAYTKGSSTELLKALDGTVEACCIGSVCRLGSPTVCVRLNVVADHKDFQSASAPEAKVSSEAWLQEKQSNFKQIARGKG